MAQITLSGVRKTFNNGDVVAVKDLDLVIEDGEFLVLLGPSGCGKTTTLRMIAGLEQQTSGDIRIGDQLVNNLSAGERDIAFVFQFYALYPHLSVQDNISFPLRAQKLSRDEVERRVQEVATRLRIDHVLKRRPNRLPGGEQQRVALGRAMVRQPQVFLMDEPLTNLDASLRADMRTELKSLQHELGTTMVYVTHDQIEAMSMSHRIAVMNLGVLQQIDTPLNIYNYPQTLFVATFIGSPPMNIIKCDIADSQLINEQHRFYYPVPTEFASKLYEHRQAYVGIRSENIEIGPYDQSSPLHGEILVREPLGDETIYVVNMNGHYFTAKTSPKVRLSPGDEVGLNFQTDRLHFFDVVSERRL